MGRGRRKCIATHFMSVNMHCIVARALPQNGPLFLIALLNHPENQVHVPMRNDLFTSRKHATLFDRPFHNMQLRLTLHSKSKELHCTFGRRSSVFLCRKLPPRHRSLHLFAYRNFAGSPALSFFCFNRLSHSTRCRACNSVELVSQLSVCLLLCKPSASPFEVVLQLGESAVRAWPAKTASFVWDRFSVLSADNANYSAQ